MLALSLHPKPKEKVQFDFSQTTMLPENSGCYVLATFRGDILYVGQSANIARRMAQHLDDPTKRATTPAGKAFWFYYELCESHRLDGLERGWVNAYTLKEGDLPFFNKVRPPV